MKSLHVLNLGAGVQSTALYLMSLRRDEPEHVPVFDAAVFADTGEEPRAVYDHLQWLKSLGGPPIIETAFGKLGDDLVRGHKTVTRKETAKYRPGEEVKQVYGIPSFLLASDGSRGLARRKCTAAYKIDPVNRAIRRRLLGLDPGQAIPKNVHVYQYFGLSFDEPSRVRKVLERSKSVRWSTARVPLFDLEWDRGDCGSYLREAAPGRTVPRSACTFCPYHSNEEWRRIRDEDPEAWARAIEIDEALRTPGTAASEDLVSLQFLHRSCVPLAVADISEKQTPTDQYLFSFASECEGMCGN